MRFHRPLHDREAQAGSTDPAAHERFEKPLPQFLRHTRTMVADPEQDGVIQQYARREVGPPGITRLHRHTYLRIGCLHRIQDEVHGDPMEQVLVALQGGFLDRDVDGCVRGAVRMLAHDVHGLFRHLAELDRPEIRDLHAGEVEELSEEAAQPVALAYD